MDCCKHNRLDVRSESVNLRRDLFRHLAPRQKGWLPLVAQAFFRIKDCAALESRIGSLQMDSFSLAASPADKSLTMVSNTAMWWLGVFHSRHIRTCVRVFHSHLAMDWCKHNRLSSRLIKVPGRHCLRLGHRHALGCRHGLDHLTASTTSHQAHVGGGFVVPYLRVVHIPIVASFISK